MLLITRLVLASNREGHPLRVITEEGWSAQPLLLQGVQNDHFSCGLWVLACIAAVLQGCHVTGIREGELLEFKQAVLRHILHLL
jgi:hypothetical protein